MYRAMVPALVLSLSVLCGLTAAEDSGRIGGLPTYVQRFTDGTASEADAAQTCLYVLCNWHDPSTWDVGSGSVSVGDPMRASTIGLGVNHPWVIAPLMALGRGLSVNPRPELPETIVSLRPEYRTEIIEGLIGNGSLVASEPWLVYYDVLPGAADSLAKMVDESGVLSAEVLGSSVLNDLREPAYALALNKEGYLPKMLSLLRSGGEQRQAVMGTFELYPRRWALPVMVENATDENGLLKAVTYIVRMRPDNSQAMLESLLTATTRAVERLACLAGLESLGAEGRAQEIEKAIALMHEAGELQDIAAALVAAASQRAPAHVEECVADAVAARPEIVAGRQVVSGNLTIRLTSYGTASLVAAFEPALESPDGDNIESACKVIAYFPEAKYAARLTVLLRSYISTPDLPYVERTRAQWVAAALLRCIAAREGKAAEYRSPENKTNWRM